MRYAGFGDIKQISCSGQTSDIRSNKTVIANQLVNLSTKSFRAETILEEVSIYFDLFEHINVKLYTFSKQNSITNQKYNIALPLII